MSDGRTVWLAKDAAWWRREAVIEMLEEVGPVGPAVVDWLACEAKAQNQGGMVKAGYRAIAHGLFIELSTVCPLVSLGVRVGLLDDFREDGRTFTCRISGWESEQGRAIRAAKKARQRAAAERDSPANKQFPRSQASPAVSPPVPPSPEMSPTGQDRTGHIETPTESHVEPADREQVWGAWLSSTGRSRSVLDAKRKRIIDQALKSHGLDDCLAAVRNIGADPWAGGANDRGKPFNGIEHALGSAERIERWRDAVPKPLRGVPGGKYDAAAAAKASRGEAA